MKETVYEQLLPQGDGHVIIAPPVRTWAATRRSCCVAPKRDVAVPTSINPTSVSRGPNTGIVLFATVVKGWGRTVCISFSYGDQPVSAPGEKIADRGRSQQISARSTSLLVFKRRSLSKKLRGF